MPLTDELILQQLNDINALLKRLEILLAKPQHEPSNALRTEMVELKSYPHQYCDEKIAAELTGMSRAWFQRMRWAGGGPQYSKMGTSKGAGVRYKVANLIA
ncbi:hypothetical protein KF728_12790 [Candidatus Obscuribacterales bacterium]|nr:hypothetical protein [Candidatus Obscuribacterales bacterium]MBX3151020.1 hypothetical protein [Candidatus Obscuribacterales bacterium]